MARRRTPRTLAVVVLAAGHGKRLRSERPKVLHELCGRPLLWHVLKAADALRPGRLIVVVGKGRDLVREAVSGFGLRSEPVFVHQREQLGTGHAVQVAEEAAGDVDDVVVLPGDEPLVTADQLKELLRMHRRGNVAGVIQTTVPEDPRGYARVIRDGEEFVRLAEGTDATREELAVMEVATAIYAFRREDLYRALPLVDRDNRQREYYLPDVPGILKEKGERLLLQRVHNGGAVGANSRLEMARAAAVLRARILERHMEHGVTVVDPSTTYVDVEVRIGRDAVLHPMTFLQGATRVGERAEIGPSTRLTDTDVGSEAVVQFAVARGARIGPRVSVGPYASLRPGTVLREGSKAGTFVELKQTTVGKGSKVPHLAYMGDATIGEGANIGAGTITCNYDGYEKHPTVIGDGAFIGSDTMLVAPVRVGKRAVTAAGSAITRDVPPEALGVERAEQRNVEGYAQRRARRSRKAESTDGANAAEGRADEGSRRGGGEGRRSGKDR